MSRAVSRVRAVVFGTVVAAALGFGASQTVAAPPVCPRTALGACNSQENCERTCTRAGYPVGQGCVNGCCYCQII